MPNPARWHCDACRGMMARFRAGSLHLERGPRVTEISAREGYAIIECTSPCFNLNTWRIRPESSSRPDC